MSPGLFRLVIEAEVEAEIEEAVQWYESRERGLGRKFIRAFASATAKLRRNPFLYQIVSEGARRLLLRRFPYAVFYEIYGSEVVVIACLHEAQDPGIWYQRLSRR